MVLKWGIMGAGRISNDFAKALLTRKDENEIIAVAARDLCRAQEFAKLYGIPKAYSGYQTLAEDPEVEVIYVGNVIVQHYMSCKLFLEHGKHVICEKPLTLNRRQTKHLIELSALKNRFLMEAIWSRCFPVYERLGELVKSGAIGEVKHIDVTFGKPLEHKERIVDKRLGGGSTLDLGVYCLQLGQFVYGGARPEKVAAAGHLNRSGTDTSASAVLRYPAGRLLALATSAAVELPNEAVLVGTKGVARVPDFWQPTRIFGPEGEERFDLPETPFDSERAAGLCYEVDEVNRCIRAGARESSRIRHEETLQLAELMDEIRAQVGVVYDADLV